MTAAPAAPRILGHTFVRLLSSRGGFGDVYLYLEIALQREVAIKVIRDPALDDASRAKFETEARAMAALEHPNVVRIYGTGLTEEGRPYITMMYCPKATMAERSLAGRLGLHDVLDIGVAIAGAVESAHRAGVLHRDIKPANILTMPWGAPGLTDFGVAASLSGDAVDEDAGVSIPWSPPEMLFTSTRGSRASDVYSLSATIWHMLVGRSPFEVPSGDNTRMSMMSRIRDANPPRTGRSDVPESMERILRRGLAKEPAMRPQTAAELGRSLQAVQMELRLPVTPFVVLETRDPSSSTSPLTNEPHQGSHGTHRRQLPGHVPVISTSSEVLRVAPLGESGQSKAGPYGGLALSGSDGVRPADLESITTGGRRSPTTGGVEPSRGLGSGALLGGLALVAAAALTLGYVAFGRGGDGVGSGSVSSSTTSTAGGGGLAPPPGELEFAQARVGESVEFAWTYDNADPGDRYRWAITRQAGSATKESDSGTTSERTLVVDAPEGTTVCLTVTVIPANLSLQSASAPVCQS